MLRQHTFTILLLLLLSFTASYGMYMAGGAPMVPQAGYPPGPMQFGAGPFMGHHNALMMPHPDYDHPDIHPAMYHHQAGFAGIPGMTFAGHPPPGAFMAGQPGVPQVVHQPGALSRSSAIQSSAGGVHASAVQPQAGVPNPNMIQHGAVHGVASQPQVNQVVAQSSGRAVNPSAGHLVAGHQRPSSVQHLAAAQSGSRVVSAGQHGASAAYPAVVQQRAITQTAGQPPHGAASTGQVSAARTSLVQPGTGQVGAARTSLVQPGSLSQAANRAGVRVVQAQPGAVSTRYVAGPQPRMPTAGVGGQLSRMPMGQYGAVAMGRPGPFPRDGTYRTAHGEYVRDGSDLSFNPRY